MLLAAGADIGAPGGNNIYMNAFEYACGTGKVTTTIFQILSISLLTLAMQVTSALCICSSMPVPRFTSIRPA